MKINSRATVKTYTSSALQRCENKKCTKTNTRCLIPYTGKVFDWDSAVVIGCFIACSEMGLNFYGLVLSSSKKEKKELELEQIVCTYFQYFQCFFGSFADTSFCSIYTVIDLVGWR